MGKFTKSASNTGKKKRLPKSRKQVRKEKRLAKKGRKNEHYQKKFVNVNSDSSKSNFDKTGNKLQKKQATSDSKLKPNAKTKNKITNEFVNTNKSDSFEMQRANHKIEIQMKKTLENEMRKQRKTNLLEENEDEDMVIKKLEKQLKMNKRKSKTMPKSFAEEGLDYLLEICDSDRMKNTVKTDKNLHESGSEFEEDLAVITGQKRKKLSKKKYENEEFNDESLIDSTSDIDSDDQDENYKRMEDSDGTLEEVEDEDFESLGSDDDDNDEKEYDDDDDDDDDNKEPKAKKQRKCKTGANKIGKNCNEDNDKSFEESGESEPEDISEEDAFEDDVSDCNDDRKEAKESDEFWEDIYGRKRDRKGNVIQSTNKYIPPHLKAKQLPESSEKIEQMSRLRKQIKGLLNRLAENNLHNIVSQIDQLYMQNSRNDMNETLTKLLFECLLQPTMTPERLVSEHMMLIAALHANVGMEVGAHFLQAIVEKFDSLYKTGLDDENKEIDNILQVIAYLYNFKVFHAVLMFDLLNKISNEDSLGAKEVELLLVVLRCVGFSLRKDDPLALKNLILKVQTSANNASNQSRVRFMLDILTAIKNNNVSKIPQYDASNNERLKKVLKTLVSKGKYITELKVSLEDLLKAPDRGRWWVVGSAWTGNALKADDDEKPNLNVSSFSSTLLDLAKKQRMNTDARRNIFCIIMSAEDYLDAFEKILRLGYKGQQEQEIVHVLMHCSLQEKSYNPYYTHLAAHFCSNDRKFQMTLQYNLWDRLKELKDLKSFQITNLARFLALLFLQKALPLSALKVIEFATVEKPCVRLLRQLFLAMLLDENEENIANAFRRISQSPKLSVFRESIRLFFHHFVLRNINKESLNMELLKQRINLAENALICSSTIQHYSSKVY